MVTINNSVTQLNPLVAFELDGAVEVMNSELGGLILYFNGATSVSFYNSTFSSNVVMSESVPLIQFYDSAFTNVSFSFSNTSVYLTEQQLMSSNLIARNSVVVFVRTISIRGSIDSKNSILTMQGSVLSTPVTLKHSNLTIYNSTFVGDQVPAVKCVDQQSQIVGELEDWTLSSMCNGHFAPFPINQSISDISIVYNGMTNYINVIVQQNIAKVIINIDTNTTSSSSAIDQINQTPGVSSSAISLTLYLVQAQCQEQLNITQYNYVQNVTQLSSASIVLDPSSPLMHPSPNATTYYCLITESHSINPGDSFHLSAEFVPRMFTSSSVVFVPKNVYFYTRYFVVQYALYDQWDDLFSVDEPLQFYSPECNNNGSCGTTYSGLPTAERLIEFDISPDWTLWTRVNVTLQNQSQPAIGYGN